MLDGAAALADTTSFASKLRLPHCLLHRGPAPADALPIVWRIAGLLALIVMFAHFACYPHRRRRAAPDRPMGAVRGPILPCSPFGLHCLFLRSWTLEAHPEERFMRLHSIRQLCLLRPQEFSTSRETSDLRVADQQPGRDCRHRGRASRARSLSGQC